MFIKPVSLALWFLCCFVSVAAGQYVKSTPLSEKNEFGGKTIEHMSRDYSLHREYFGREGERVKMEHIFPDDYPILTGIKRLISYYGSGKKIKEETVYTFLQSRLTMIERSIEHYDRSSGELIKKETHFVAGHMGYNILFFSAGRKNRIEWFYPDRETGIVKSITFLDDKGQDYKTVNYYAHRTSLKKGYYKRVYYKEYNRNRYYRKSRQEWYFSDEYGKSHDNIYRKTEKFLYPDNKETVVQTYHYDKLGKLIEVPGKQGGH